MSPVGRETLVVCSCTRGYIDAHAPVFMRPELYASCMSINVRPNQVYVPLYKRKVQEKALGILLTSYPVGTRDRDRAAVPSYSVPGTECCSVCPPLCPTSTG